MFRICNLLNLFLLLLLLLSSLLGSVIVIIGLYILLWGKNKEMQDCVLKVAQEAKEIKEQEPKLQVVTVSRESPSI